MRRNLARTEPKEDPLRRTIAIGDFKIDADAFRVYVKNIEIRLTPKEFELLLYLAKHAGRVRDTVPANVVRDYIAGMTDRFAKQEFRRLCSNSSPE